MTTVDGRHRPASSDCCPASVGLLSGLRRTAVRNQSDSLSAFIEMRNIGKSPRNMMPLQTARHPPSFEPTF